jgi:MFS family permease
MSNYWQTFRRFNRDIRLYLLYWSMISFAYFGVVGVLMNLYLLRLGYGPEFIGLVLGSGQLAWAVFSLPAGFIGSRIGAKQSMTVGMLVIAAATALMLAAEALPPDLRAAGLVVAWMVSWTGASLSAVNGAPYLMSITDAHTRGYAFSAQQTVMAAAGFAGSLAAGVLPGFFAGLMGLTLDHPAPYRAALLLAPLAYLTGAILFSRAKSGAAVLQQETSPTARRAPIFLFLFLGLIIALQSFSEGTVRAFYNVYLDTTLNLPTNQIGGIMGTAQLLLVFISLIIPAVLSRWGTRGSISGATLGLSVFILMLAWVPTRYGAAISYLGLSAMLMMIVTARGIYSQEAVVPRWRTTISAVSTGSLALGWASAAWLGGFLVNAVGFQGLFLLGSLFALLSVSLLSVLFRRDAAQAVLETHPTLEPTVITVTGDAEES